MKAQRTNRSWGILVSIAAVLGLGAVAVAEIPEGSPVAEALRRAEGSVDRIVQIPDVERTFDNTLGALDDLQAQLELDTNNVMFLAYVSTDPDERARGQQAEQDVTNWLIELSKREDLYRAVKAVADDGVALTGERQRFLEHVLRDYRRAGMGLSVEQRDKLMAIQKELTKLSIEFEENFRVDETIVPLLREELPGMSDDFIASLEISNGVYLLNMSYPQFLPLIDFCDDERTRQKVWLAYKRRGGKKNVQVLEQIIALRAQSAQILGYDHPADYEIEVRMAKDADTVMAFYEKLRPLVREKALRDYAELVAAKREHTGNPKAELYPWDASYYMNYLKMEKYAVDMEEVQKYFPLERVIDGLFGITQSLYGLRYVEVTDRARSAGRTWHEDVKVFEVWDEATDEVLGEFFIDLHPRDQKYGHAAQWGIAQHKVWSDGRVTKPVAALVCNFTKPTATKPSLLTHDEVSTFFHEFGHCLHTILSESEFWRFAGTGVERDFVEAPSQMLENWVWDADVLQTFARHYETGEPIPPALVDGLLAARYVGSGMLAEHQFYYGLMDMHCHLDPKGEVDTISLSGDLWGDRGEGVELYEAVPGTWYHAAFGHFTGYQAGYYGYQWSLVYACDMFQRFKELGMLDPEAGKYYRRMILAKGGTEDGLDLVRGYLGREPDMTAYLKHLGLE